MVFSEPSFVYGYFPLMRTCYLWQLIGFMTSVCVCFLLFFVVPRQSSESAAPEQEEEQKVFLYSSSTSGLFLMFVWWRMTNDVDMFLWWQCNEILKKNQSDLNFSRQKLLFPNDILHQPIRSALLSRQKQLFPDDIQHQPIRSALRTSNTAVARWRRGKWKCKCKKQNAPSKVWARFVVCARQWQNFECTI